MEFKFTEANVMDVINAVSIEIDPLPADVDIPAVQKSLHEHRIKIFTLKKSIIYGLLTKTFEKNHEGFAHIGAIAIGDGLTAWKIFAAMIIESSGDAKTDFST